MNDIWNKDHRNGKVSQKTVSFLDQCQKPELCDAKINQTADQCDDNLTGGDAFSGVYVRSFCFWCSIGYIIFAGRGPHVSVRLLPVGHASVKLISTIESAGINQTCHTIRAEVTAEVQTAIPFAQTTTKTTYACLLSETLIVGTVPDSYMEFESTSDSGEKQDFRE